MQNTIKRITTEKLRIIVFSLQSKNTDRKDFRLKSRTASSNLLQNKLPHVNISGAAPSCQKGGVQLQRIPAQGLKQNGKWKTSEGFVAEIPTNE
jgi:hypothetical protein